MNHRPLTVCQLFRKPDAFFSIERVFRKIEQSLDEHVSIVRWGAPEDRFTPAAILRNLLSASTCEANVYHVTGHLHYLVLALPRRRTILTIHDCVFLYHTTGWKRRLLKLVFLDIPVRYCRVITTVSAATKTDIVRHTGCRPDKIVVIPNPVDDSVYHSPLDFNGEMPVVLFIGSTPHKNLRRVAEALSGLRCQLEIVGRVPPDIAELLHRRGVRYNQQCDLTDLEIARKYAEADLVLFPSTFEGFGLPILEAQKAGRPVITSDIGPMNEIAGSGACLVDPFDIESIRTGILKVISDSGYREQLVKKGLENLERFSPQVIAQQYLACYRRLT